jgi:hypothetical protein
VAIKKIVSSREFLVFPIALLLIYWANMYIKGQEIEMPVPATFTFATLAVMILLEQFFNYARRVSQKPLVYRDLASTLMNLLATGAVMRMIFVPVVLFLPEIFFGRSLFFSAPQQLGPFWHQLI